VGDQRPHRDATSDGRFERFFEFRAVEPKNDYVDGLLGLADGFEHRRQAILWLRYQFHDT
jgi:hypothetical protein